MQEIKNSNKMKGHTTMTNTMNLPANYTLIDSEELSYLNGGFSLLDVANAAVTVVGIVNAFSIGANALGTLAQGGSVVDALGITAGAQASSAELLTNGLKFAASIWSAVSIGKFVADKLGKKAE
jgi:hypothetical protein